MLPLDDESSAALKGKQIKYYTEEYIYGVGRGGIKYMTYNYSDQEWKEYVASKGGILDYASADEQKFNLLITIQLKIYTLRVELNNFYSAGYFYKY